MYYPAFLTLLPCRYYRFCQGHINPTQPNQGSLCLDCLAKGRDGHERLQAKREVDRGAYEECAANDALSAQALNGTEVLMPLSSRFLYRYPVRVYFEHATAHVLCPDYPEVQAAGESVEQAMAQALDCLKSTLTLYVKQGRRIPHARVSTDSELTLQLPMMTIVQTMLWNAMCEERVSRAELARRMGCTSVAANRLVDFRLVSKIGLIERALGLLGRQLIVGLEGNLMCINSSIATGKRFGC